MDRLDKANSQYKKTISKINYSGANEGLNYQKLPDFYTAGLHLEKKPLEKITISTINNIPQTGLSMGHGLPIKMLAKALGPFSDLASGLLDINTEENQIKNSSNPEYTREEKEREKRRFLGINRPEDNFQNPYQIYENGGELNNNTMNTNFAQRAKDIVAKHGKDKKAALAELDQLRREQFNHQQQFANGGPVNIDKELEKGITVEEEHKKTYDFIADTVNQTGQMPTPEQVYKSIALDHIGDYKKMPVNRASSYYKKLIEGSGDKGITDEASQYANGGSIHPLDIPNDELEVIRMMSDGGPIDPKYNTSKSIIIGYDKNTNEPIFDVAWTRNSDNADRLTTIKNSTSSGVVPNPSNVEWLNEFYKKNAINDSINTSKKIVNNNISKLSNGGFMNSYASGGGIHINPANVGKFTATKERTGKTTEELTHSTNPLTRKRAIFAQNAKKWKHEDGGELDNTYGDGGNAKPGILINTVGTTNQNYIDSLSNVARSNQYDMTQQFKLAHPNVPVDDILKGFDADKNFRNTNLDQKADSLTNIYGDLSIPTTDAYQKTAREYSNLTNMQGGMDFNRVGTKEDGTTTPAFGWRAMGMKYPHQQGTTAYSVPTIHAVGGPINGGDIFNLGSVSYEDGGIVPPNANDSIMSKYWNTPRSAEWYRNASGRVESTASPIDYGVGAVTMGPINALNTMIGAPSTANYLSGNVSSEGEAMSGLFGGIGKVGKLFGRGTQAAETAATTASPRVSGFAGRTASPAAEEVGSTATTSTTKTAAEIAAEKEAATQARYQSMRDNNTSVWDPVAIDKFKNAMKTTGKAALYGSPVAAVVGGIGYGISQMPKKQNDPLFPVSQSNDTTYAPTLLSKDANGKLIDTPINANGAPQSTSQYVRPGVSVPESSLTRSKSERFNNPLNITDEKGNIREFKTYDEGSKAGLSDLSLKLSGNSPAYINRMKSLGVDPSSPVTAENLAETWAPSNAPGNSKEATVNYGRAIAAALGIKPNDPLPKDPASTQKIFDAMKAFESGHGGSGAGHINIAPSTSTAPVVRPSNLASLKNSGDRYKQIIPGLQPMGNTPEQQSVNAPGFNYNDAMRYAPIGMNLISALTARKGKGLSDINLPTISPTLISPEQLSTAPVEGAIGSQYRSGIDTLSGATGGSGAAVRSGLNSLSLAGARGAGEAYNDIYSRNAMLRGDATKYNANATDQANRTNLEQANRQVQLNREGQVANQQDAAARDAYRMQSLNAAATGLGKISNEKVNENLAKGIYGIDPRTGKKINPDEQAKIDKAIKDKKFAKDQLNSSWNRYKKSITTKNPQSTLND